MTFKPLIVMSCVLASLPCVSARAAGGAEDDVEGLIKNIQARYEHTQDLRADFTQVTLFKGFDSPFTSRGRLSIKRPGKMRWDYQEPSRQQIYVDGEKILFYVPEHKQVIKTLLSRETDSQIPLRFLSWTAGLQDEFVVTLEGDSLVLTPKAATPHLLRATLEVEKKTSYIQKITLFAPNGNTSSFSFTHIEGNKGVSDETFSFVIPKDVEVIEPPPPLP